MATEEEVNHGRLSPPSPKRPGVIICSSDGEHHHYSFMYSQVTLAVPRS